MTMNTQPSESRSAWTLWGMEASVAVTDPGLLAGAKDIVRAVTASVDEACSRFRTDSELARLQPRLAAGAPVSPLLARLVGSALEAARWTDGDVDPTLGRDLDALGYGRDILSIALSPDCAPARPRKVRRAPGWSRISIDDGTLRVPEDVRLDLGATAKAVAADLAARAVFSSLGVGVLVSLGGDLSSSGPGPEGGWQILVQDLPDDPAQQVSLAPGFGMATSSTQKRRWQHAGTSVHHILDPRFGVPAEPVWRSVTVAAPSCLEANAFTTAAVVRGFAAVDWFRRHRISGRFVDGRGRTVVTGGWPAEQRAATAGECFP
jgi:thiamine biosynthesis lipoprotein